MNLRSLLVVMTDVAMGDSSSIIAKEEPAPTAGTTRTIRLFLLFEAATFVAAASIHFGVFIGGYEHGVAGMAESVIALVLLGGFTATWIRPAFTRGLGLAAQGVALLGTLVGVFTIVAGVGPRTPPDIAYHVGILAVLAWGLIIAKWASTDRARQPA